MGAFLELYLFTSIVFQDVLDSDLSIEMIGALWTCPQI